VCSPFKFLSKSGFFVGFFAGFLNFALFFNNFFVMFWTLLFVGTFCGLAGCFGFISRPLMDSRCTGGFFGDGVLGGEEGGDLEFVGFGGDGNLCSSALDRFRFGSDGLRRFVDISAAGR
jgi:hypothetical protein